MFTRIQQALKFVSCHEKHVQKYTSARKLRVGRAADSTVGDFESADGVPSGSRLDEATIFADATPLVLAGLTLTVVFLFDAKHHDHEIRVYLRKTMETIVHFIFHTLPRSSLRQRNCDLKGPVSPHIVG